MVLNLLYVLDLQIEIPCLETGVVLLGDRGEKLNW